MVDSTSNEPARQAAELTDEPTSLPVEAYDDDFPPPIDFDAWSLLAAKLLHRDAETAERLLDDRKVLHDVWHATNHYWLLRMAREMARGDMARAMRYAGHCADELRERAPAPKGAEQAVVAKKGVFNPVDQTGFAQALSDDVLPFDSERAPATSPPQAPVDALARSASRPGETQSMRALTDVEELPFDRNAQLKRYAELCRELAVKGTDQTAVMARYGMNDRAALAALHQKWSTLLQADPALRAQFDKLVRKSDDA